MIKCNVTVCGIVSREVTNRTNNDGNAFMTFAMNVAIPARNGINKTVEISVVKDGIDDGLTELKTGRRIEVSGILTMKKRGENLYFNLSANSVNVTSAEDSIKGDMDFRGKIGKTIEEKTDKNGKPYIQFSAFSAEKLQDGFEYLWVRFIRFEKGRESWLQPATKIEAKGELELSVFNDRLNLSCRVKDISEYVKPPYNPNAEQS